MGVTTRSWRHACAVGGALLIAAVFPAAGVQASTAKPAAGDAAAGPAAARSAGPIPVRLPGGLQRPATAQAGLSLTFLFGVFCTSARNCWAVGEREAPSGMAVLNQMLHWNGRSWREASVPNPGGTSSLAENYLYAVRCLRAASCWAVGEYSRNDGLTVLTQALHWNGRKWSRVPTPNPGGTGTRDNSELFDVTCVTSASCWSVGDFGTVYTSPHQKLLNLVLRWNGRKWSRVRLANPGGTTSNRLNELFGVRCGSSRNCNAVGDYGTGPGSTNRLFNQAFHWNGRKWSLTRTPNPGGSSPAKFSETDGLGCGSATNCWSAGAYGTFESGLTEPMTALNQILHWNGRKWTKATAPNPAGTASGDVNELTFATCSSTRNCWAVGGYGKSILATRNQTLHWNGRKWSFVHAPSPGTQISLLDGARCTSTRNCWAVGFKLSTPDVYRNVILHWNGRKWSVYPAPGS